MMGEVEIGVFIVGYIAIAFEHKIKVDKAGTALVTGVLCWLFYFLNSQSVMPSMMEELWVDTENSFDKLAGFLKTLKGGFEYP